MNKKSLQIGFIGVGLMGYGMALNLINNNFNLAIIAHKNRKPIDKLVKKGAKEILSVEEFAKKCNVIILCLPNTSYSDANERGYSNLFISELIEK
jgi:3-hydroxyisobutyrate dehydrogenase-like beta-hydroxyacid dehydrogenase